MAVVVQIPVMVYKKGTTIYESGAAVQFLVEELGDGRLEPRKGSKDRAAYLQVIMLPFPAHRNKVQPRLR